MLENLFEGMWLVIVTTTFRFVHFPPLGINEISLHYHKTNLNKAYLVSVLSQKKVCFWINVLINLTTTCKKRHNYKIRQHQCVCREINYDKATSMCMQRNLLPRHLSRFRPKNLFFYFHTQIHSNFVTSRLWSDFL